MKNLYSIIFLCFLVSNNLFSQSTKVLLNFEVFQKQNQVHITWTINAGNTCLGIDIERATTPGAFERIGTITGICGSPVENVSYQFIDENPITNTTSLYRINMGVLGISKPIEIRFIDTQKYSTLVTPNPNFGRMAIHLPVEIPYGSTLEFRTSDGTLLQEKIIYGETEKIYVEMDEDIRHKGVIFYIIIDPNKKAFYQGYFIRI